MDENVNFAPLPHTERGMKVTHLGSLGAFDMSGGGAGLGVSTDSQGSQSIPKEEKK